MVDIQRESKQCYYSSRQNDQDDSEDFWCGVAEFVASQDDNRRYREKFHSDIINSRHVMRLFFPHGRCKPDKKNDHVWNATPNSSYEHFIMYYKVYFEEKYFHRDRCSA